MTGCGDPNCEFHAAVESPTPISPNTGDTDIESILSDLTIGIAEMGMKPVSKVSVEAGFQALETAKASFTKKLSEARIEEVQKTTIAIEARLDTILSQNKSFDAQELIGKYRRDRIAELQASKEQT